LWFYCFSCINSSAGTKTAHQAATLKKTYLTSADRLSRPARATLYICSRMLDTREFKSQRSRYAAERIDLLAANRRSEPILLELVLRIQGDLRRALAPIGVTPLQAGVLCYLRQHADARLIDAAKAFRLEPPTLTDVVQDLVRKGWLRIGARSRIVVPCV
jgi:hypothetical protein